MNAHAYMKKYLTEALTIGNLHLIKPEELSKYGIPKEIDDSDPKSVLEAFREFISHEPIEISVIVILHYGRIMGLLEMTSGERGTVRKPAVHPFAKVIASDGTETQLSYILSGRDAIWMHNHPETRWGPILEKAKAGESLTEFEKKHFKSFFYSHEGDYQAHDALRQDLSESNCLLKFGYTITTISCCRYKKYGCDKFYTTDPDLVKVVKKVTEPQKTATPTDEIDDMFNRARRLQRQQAKARKAKKVQVQV